MNLFRLLVVARGERGAQSIQAAAASLEGTSVAVAPSIRQAKESLETAVFDALIVDLAIESGSGIDLVLDARKAHPGLSILVVTDEHLRDYDRDAIRAGVDGFIVRPLRREHVAFQLAHAREVRRLRDEYARLRESAGGAMASEGLVGVGSEMANVFHLVARAGASSVPVALYGESGTGKELVAHAIHRASARRDGPFVAVNPSAIPESLLESELFGYVRGAFTGAGAERVGHVEAAHGGTLFLDEIGDLPVTFQGKFLRVLQHKTIQRVGSSRPVHVDFRLLTATHRDLFAEVRAGRFREDLFYRIHVFPVYLPPLRARRSDIPLLAEHFLRKYSSELDQPLAGFGPGVLEVLMSYTWPGNVRELENVVQRLVAMKGGGSMIELPDLVGLVEGVQPGTPLQRDGAETFTGDVRPLGEVIDDYIAWAYRKLGRNKSRTAQQLKIDRTTLHRRLRRMARDLRSRQREDRVASAGPQHRDAGGTRGE